MNPDFRRRQLLGGALAGGTLSLAGAAGLAGCGGGGDGNAYSGFVSSGTTQDKQIALALAQVDSLGEALMTSTGIPGMAIAMVRGDQLLYARGFGVKVAGTRSPVDADTVFQLASMSKPIGASVVARQVGAGNIAWETPIQRWLPWFRLSNPDVSAQVTVGDMYAHRTGLPHAAGDKLEDMGDDQRKILEQLRYLPLTEFRNSYAYANYGTTTGGITVATAAGVDWATLSQRNIYGPLGMTRTSSRFADYQARDNRAVGHIKVDGVYVPGPVRMPDTQAPAASVTSSVNDVAKWLSMMLGKGAYKGQRVVDAAALAPATSRQIMSSPAVDGRPPGYYGFGFNVGVTAAGNPSYGHSGAFSLGAGTAFTVVPQTGIGIVVLTNASPIGVAEAFVAQLFDLVQFGAIQQPWQQIYAGALAPVMAPDGSLVGVPRPTNPKPPSKTLTGYVGQYANDYYGPAQVVLQNGALTLVIGATPLRLPLAHWDGEVFTFTLFNENATPGTISKATFDGNRMVLEYYDVEGLGTFVRAG